MSAPQTNYAEMLNVYEQPCMVKYNTSNYEMGGLDQHNIVFPKHVVVASGTGGGKSSWLSNYLRLSAAGCGTFGHVTIVCTGGMEKIYDMLQEKLKDNITFYHTLAALPKLKDFGNKDVQQLLVFDDCVAERDQSKIEEYYLRGRKYGRGIQCIYLSQSYMKCPIFLRLNAAYLILLTLSSDADMGRIMQNYNCGVEMGTLKRIFKNAVSSHMHAFKIDITTCDLNRKFSKDWNQFYELVDNENEPIQTNQIQLF